MYSIVNSAYCSMRGDSIEGRSVRMIADVIVRIHPLTPPLPHYNLEAIFGMKSAVNVN